MSEEQIKKATELAENEFNNKKNEKINSLVKKIVQEALERIEVLEQEMNELNEEKKQLKMTIDDLKAGRMDLLKERLEKDKTANTVIPTVIHITEIIREKTPYRNPWQEPWTVWYGGTTYNGTSGDFKHATFGTYCLSNGKIINLR